LRKITLLISFFCAIAVVQNAQTLAKAKNKVFHGIGYTAILDIIKTPSTQLNYSGLDQNGNPTSITENVQLTGFSFMTLIYRFRYNIYELSDNRAIGLSASPALGLSLFLGSSDYPNGIGGNMVGLGDIDLPIFLEWESGAGSTYSSSSNYGGMLGAGLDYYYLPFSNSGLTSESGDPITYPKYSYVQFALEGGIRYWNKINRLHEINLKVDLGGSESYGFRLSWIRFLNY